MTGNHKPFSESDLPSGLDSQPLHGDERWELFLRIVSSPPFRKSPRLRQFLAFVTERSLTGHTEEITEYEIGWKVFDRGGNYNPSDDSIVRTAARQLRTKVKEYFDAEGGEEEWLLEIPKGGYVPIFTRRERKATLNPAQEAPSVRPSSTRTERVLRWQILTAVLTVLAICSLIFTLRLWKETQAFRVAAPPSIVSTVLLHGPQSTRVIVGDFGTALITLATKQSFSVEDYANRSYAQAIPAEPSAPIVQYLWNLFKSGQIVSYPDVTAAGAIMRLSGQEGKKAVIQDARQISARDLRSGNFILLSAPIASPWMTLFEEKLNFRYRLWFNDDSPLPITEFENLHPLLGEKPTYRAAATSPSFGVTYGLVAKVPNLTNTGKVLLIYGLRYTGLEAAGEYATDPKSAEELAHLLHVADINSAPDFEVLVETYSLNAAPRYVKVAAFRRIN